MVLVTRSPHRINRVQSFLQQPFGQMLVVLYVHTLPKARHPRNRPQSLYLLSIQRLYFVLPCGAHRAYAVEI